MKEQVIDLNQLIKKYKTRIESLQREIDETKNKMTIAYNALKLLEQEGLRIEKDLFEMPVYIIKESLSEKYKNYGMRDAIKDILKEHPGKFLSGEEIYDDLIKNGFKSKSKNIKRDVYIQLYRMEKDGKIISKKEEGRKKYTLKEIE